MKFTDQERASQGSHKLPENMEHFDGFVTIHALPQSHQCKVNCPQKRFYFCSPHVSFPIMLRILYISSLPPQQRPPSSHLPDPSWPSTRPSGTVSETALDYGIRPNEQRPASKTHIYPLSEAPSRASNHDLEGSTPRAASGLYQKRRRCRTFIPYAQHRFNPRRVARLH